MCVAACDCSEGDEIIVTAYSWSSSATCILHHNCIPVFVDIDWATMNIDVDKIEAAITPKTKAILCVHQIGMPCDLQSVVAIGKKHGLPVIEDAACAIGSEIEINGHWERIGAPRGDIAAFSFHPRKIVSTGDGGMLTTRNPAYDKQFKLLRQHAMSVPDTVRHGSNQVIFETHPVLGYNYRMTDIQAAVGREQLKRVPEILETRRRLAARYNELLQNNLGIETPVEPANKRSNWQSYSVTLPERCDQRAVMQSMLDAGVASRRGIMCAHREDLYKGAWDLPNSEFAQDRRLILPLYHSMTDDEQITVVDALKKACA